MIKRTKRQYRKSPKQNSEPSPPLSTISYDIIGIGLIIIALFVLMSHFRPQATGVVGKGIETIGSYLYGSATRFVPILLLVYAYIFIVITKKRTTLIASTFTFISVCMALELKTNGALGKFSWPLLKSGGGIIGWSGVKSFHYLLGPFGIRILIVGSIITTLILLSNTSIKSMCRSLFNLVFTSKEDEEEIDDLFNSPPVQPQIIEREIHKPYMIPNPEHTPSRPLIQAQIPHPTPPIDTPKELSFTITEHPKAPEKETKKLMVSNPNIPYEFPPITLFDKGSSLYMNPKKMKDTHQLNASLLEETLASFNVDAHVVNITPGPTVTRYELKPGVGVKISKITGLANDIALKLAAPSVRIEAPIPGKALIGIEIPNSKTDMISIRDIAERSDFLDNPEKLLAALGVTISGEAVLMDLGKMPHVLIAGATGSGKSVCINSIIISILLRTTPDEVRFLMIDPKKVELSLYNDIPHLLAPVVTDPHKAAATLKKWALTEMENRYEIFSRVGVKTIAGFNAKIEELKHLALTDADGAKKQWDSLIGMGDESIESVEFTPKKLPYIVVIIDELADLMMVASQDVENTICRLAQMARATGIHLVIATQRPSVNVITGLIKANVPSRISFYLQSQIDSRTVLDMGGAEKLLGKGDMLYSPVGSFKPQRLQGVFISEKEIKNIVSFVKKQSKPEYLEEILEIEPLGQEKSDPKNDSEDELFLQAKEIVTTTQYASTSFLQRKLRIGYNRAARLMDELKEKGIISEHATQSRPRDQ